MYTGLNIARGSVSKVCLNLFTGCYRSDYMVIIPSAIHGQKLGDVQKQPSFRLTWSRVLNAHAKSSTINETGYLRRHLCAAY